MVTKSANVLLEQIIRKIVSRSKEAILLWNAAYRSGTHILKGCIKIGKGREENH